MKRAHRLNLFKLTASRTSTCDTDNALYRLNEKSLLCLNINLGCTVHCFVLFMNFKPSINFHLVLRYCVVHITTNAPPPIIYTLSKVFRYRVVILQMKPHPQSLLPFHF